MIDWIRISISQIACSLVHLAGLTDIAFKKWHAYCVNREDTRSINPEFP